MASKTYHISFPMEWAKDIEQTMKRKHYSVSEFFKEVYREYRAKKELDEAIEIYEREKRQGKLKKLKSFDELM